MDTEQQYLLPIINERSVLIKRFLIVALVIIATLLESFTFFSLEIKIFYTLNARFNWPEEYVNYLANIHSYYSIAQLYFSFYGGIIADFVLPAFTVVTFGYCSFIFGGSCLLLMNINVTESDNTTLFAKLFNCGAKNHSIINHEKLQCQAASNVVLYIISFGNGIIVPILYVVACNQVRMIAPKYVSAACLLTFSSSNLGILLGTMMVTYWSDIKSLCIVCGFSLFVSFFLLIIVFKFGEKDCHRISLWTFLKELKNIVMQILYKRRKSNLQITSNNAITNTLSDDQSTLREGIKRLLSYSTLICLLIFPASILIQMVNNLSILNLGCIIIGSLMMAIFVIMFYHADDVISHYRRIFIGTICVVICFYFNGIIENSRLLMFWGPDYNTLNHSTAVTIIERDGREHLVTNLSTVLLSPSYILLGISEILTITTAIEYSYLYCPPWLLYTAVGLIFVPWGTGAWASCTFRYWLNGTIYNSFDINYRLPCNATERFLDVKQKVCWHSHLDHLFYIAASVMLVFFMTVLIIERLIKPNRFDALFWEQMITREDADNQSDNSITQTQTRNNLSLSADMFASL